ncbi:hypothetical protein [Aurantibacillus circumpalustris]|uniref:hypothetical protein n=1 Tax=Aurantibacillus circumpalustris TaxID=3036359 RepID=UPI00295AA75A|nr:hypothetical protein [Aurantibacillus circumpalustris]
MLICAHLNSCSAQPNSNENVKQEQTNLLGDSLNHPDINVKVNKQFDKNGNIIKYDSTYSYVYKSGPKGMRVDNDSIYAQFKNFFQLNSSSLLNREKDRVFLEDSLFQYDFFNDDYFEKRFDLNQNIFRDFFKQMDSIKTNFLIERYPKGNSKKK